MSLSAIPLLDDLRDHLAGDATVTDLIGESFFHARADAEAAMPLLLYRLPGWTMTPDLVCMSRAVKRQRRTCNSRPSMSRPRTRTL